MVRIETTLEQVAKDLDRLVKGVEQVVPEVARLSASYAALRDENDELRKKVEVQEDFRKKVMAYAAAISTIASVIVAVAAKFIH